MASAERKLLKIGELARMADKTVRALHLYEELELLRPARRTQGGFRMYDSANVARITYIDRLQRLGYSLGDIRALVERWEAGESPREAMASIEAAYVARLDEVRRQIRELRKLEGELVDSLDFLQGCRGCGQETEPHDACGCCERPEQTDDALPLITGLAAH